MSQIRKQYSKEWFAVRAGRTQKNAIKKFSAEQFETSPLGRKNYQKVINKDLLIGTKEQAQKRVQKAFQEGKDAQSRQIIKQFGGLDNIFDVIDMDGDGKVTREELAAISAVDTIDEFDVEDNIDFSVNDLHHLFVNLKASEGAEVEYNGNVTTYTFKNGSKTITEQDETGKIIKTTVLNNLGRKGTRTTNVSYEDKAKTVTDVDTKGRTTLHEIDLPGTKNDTVLRRSYGKDGSVLETFDTVGTSSSVLYDKNGNEKLKYGKVKYNLEADTPFKQSDEVADCWLLSQFNALNTTEKGKKIINNSIKQNADGSVTVTLKGAGKSYTYTPDEICSSEYMNDTQKSYSTGNDKVKIMELAFTDLRKDLFAKNSKLYMMANYTFTGSKKNPLEDGYFKEAFYFLTGVEPETAYLRGNVEKQLELKQNNPDQYAMVTSFILKDESFGNLSNNIPKITTFHEYTVTKVTEDTVYVVNPWDSSVEIAYPRDKFMKNCFGVGNVDLSQVQDDKQ